ncbi:2-amino-4-hydroxy-6-hydroxymethyldihydropteridine diphosphokinase [Vibrio sp. WXL210]|uniref:2-amino-4-hydroxy-6- hydroxymethyldihydropteridine diphosphokinase n=1 Tax=Vibrio sp. WXL210 TaxID=3450709 RepID=UPI003EC5B1FF
MTEVYIGVGTNIQRRKHVEAGVRELMQLGSNTRISTIYECEAVGFDSQPFYNLVVGLETSLSLNELTSRLREIEIKWGRPSDAQKNQARTLDLDILLFGETVAENPQLPRDDIYKFAFVIQPLVELCPGRVIPGGGQTVKQLWQASRSLLTQPLTKVAPWFSIQQ